MKKISIISIITISLLTLNLYANQVNNYNVTIYKDKFLISDTNTISNNLDTSINNGVEVDIIRSENINPSTPIRPPPPPVINTIPNRPVVDDNLCIIKEEAKVCQLTLSATDTEDGRITTFRATDTNSNISNLTLVGNLITFTIPRKDSVINLSITRLDSENRSSSRTPYTFTALEDSNSRFKNLLINKCLISASTVNARFNITTGTYTGNIDCTNKNLTNADFEKFKRLKFFPSSYFFLYGNQITDYSPLRNTNFSSSTLQLWFDDNKLLTGKIPRTNNFCSSRTQYLKNSRGTIYRSKFICGDDNYSFLNTLNTKCGISIVNLNKNFNSMTGTYTGTIDCRCKSMGSVRNFSVLKRVNGRATCRFQKSTLNLRLLEV